MAVLLAVMLIFSSLSYFIMPYFCIFNSCHIYGLPLYCHSKAKCVSLGSSKTEFTRNAHARCIFTVFALCTVFTFTRDNSLVNLFF